eukprot:Rmarinus@m.24537
MSSDDEDMRKLGDLNLCSPRRDPLGNLPARETRSSPLLKAKKWMGSRTGDTKMGQAIIAKYLGDDGNSLIAALQSSTERHQGKKFADKLKADVFKVAIKAAILVKEKVLTPEKTEVLVKPTLKICKDLVLAIDESRIAVDNKLDVSHIVEDFEAGRDGCIEIFSRLIRHHNVERIARVFDYYGSYGYVDNLVNNPEYKGESKVISDALKGLVIDVSDPDIREIQEYCMFSQCNLVRAPLAEGFSRYCVSHHQREYERLRTAEVDDFIYDVERRRIFMDSMPEPGTLKMYFAITDYRRTANRALRGERSRNVFDKFLSPTAADELRVTCLPSDMFEEIERKLDAGSHSPAIFNQAQKWLQRYLEEEFARFKTSGKFSEFMSSLELSNTGPN